MKLFILCQILNQLFNFDSSQWNIKQYTIKNGLSSNSVYDIVQDYNGRYWIPSPAGLAYFDGYEFKYLTSENGIKNIDLLDAHFNNGYLYTTSIKKIEAIDIRKLKKVFPTKLYSYDITNRFGVNSGNKNHIVSYIDSFYFFNGLKMKSYKLFLPYYDLYTGTFKSLITSNQHLTKLNFDVVASPYPTIYIRHFDSLCELDKEGRLRFCFKAKENITYKAIDSTFFFRDYIGKNLVEIYDKKLDRSRPIFSNDKPLSFSLEKDKGFWITTYKSGIYLYLLNRYYKKEKTKFRLNSFILSPPILNENWRFQFAGNQMKVNQTLYIENKGKVIKYPQGVKSFVKVNDSFYIIGRRDGTYLYKINEKDSLGGNLIDSAWVLKLKLLGETLCILTYDGFKFVENKHKISYRFNYKGEYVLVNDIEKNRGQYAFGTNDLGVFISNLKFKNFKHFTDKNGLQSKLIKQIKSDKYGSFWILNDRGIDKLDSNYHLTKFFSFSELNDYDIKNFTLSEDSLYLFTDDFVYSLNHKERFKKENIPIILNELLVDDTIKYFESDYNLLIGPKWGNIKVNYAGVFIHEQENIMYRYRIIRDGDTGTWQYTNQHILTLTALQPSKYVVQIQAFHKTYPNISSKILLVSFKIKPYFYQTWWFYSLIFFGLLIIMGGIIWYRNQLKLDKLKVESELHRLTLNGLQNQMNPHFVFNALNTLQHFILKKDMHNSLNFLSDFSSLIRKILENSRTDLVSIEEELNFLKQYTDIERERYQNKFKVKFSCKIDEEELSDIKIPPMLIQPLIENAVKHGVSNMERGGEITIVVELIDIDLVRVSVIDNGVGFQNSKNTSSRAITILKERLDLIQGKNKKSSFELIRKDNFTYSIINIPI